MPVVDEIELQNWLVNAGFGDGEPLAAASRTAPASRRFRRIAVERTTEQDCPCGQPHLAVISPESPIPVKLRDR